jgi:signal transduction histidine kinase/CheY-like chemotaxis protein
LKTPPPSARSRRAASNPSRATTSSAASTSTTRSPTPSPPKRPLRGPTLSRRSQSIQTRLFAGFALMLLATLIVGFLYRRALTNLETTSQWVERSQRVRVTLDELLVALSEAESGHRGYMLTLSDSYLIPYRSAMPRIQERRQMLRSLVVESDDQTALVDKLDGAIAEKLAEMDAVLDLDRSKGRDAALELVRSDAGRRFMEQVRSIGNALLSREDQLLASRRATAEAARAGVLQLSMWATVCSGLLVILAGTLLARSITVPLASVAEGAEAIGRGELDLRIAEDGDDELTALAIAFNRMAERLAVAREEANAILALKEESAALVRKMQGHNDVEGFAQSALPDLTAVLGALQAAFYVSQEAEDNDLFVRVWSQAEPAELPSTVRFGDGLLGETARSQRTLFLGAQVGFGDDEDHTGGDPELQQRLQQGIHKLRLRSALLDTEPVAMALVPFVFEGQTLGLLEIATDRPLTKHDRELLGSIAEVAGVILKAFRSNDQTRRLLRGTQDLADELQKQTEELQGLNEELEEKHRALELQRQELEGSQLTLREQQDELQALNEELEEQATVVNSRNHALEAKNQEIEAARRLVEAKVEELRLSAEFKSQFLANVSHELRTPLNSQLILSRLLQENAEGNLTAQQQGYLRTIHRSGIELLRLVDDILDLAKIEAGRLEIEPESVDLAATLTELEDAFRELARAKGLALRVVKPTGDVPTTLRTDGHRLKQILKNLIGNAIKFTEKGEVVVETALAKTGGEHAGAVMFQVRDTGIGLSPEQQTHIFEAFRQADGSTSRLYGGTGLGLSISRELAALLGGSIHVESELGKGSVFSVILGDAPASTRGSGVPSNAPGSLRPPANKNAPRGSLRRASTPGLGAVRADTSSEGPIGAPRPSTAPGGGDGRSPATAVVPVPGSNAAGASPTMPPSGGGAALGPEDRKLVVVTDVPSFVEPLTETALAAGVTLTTLSYDAEARAKLRRMHPVGLIVAIDSAEMDTASLLRADAEIRGIPVHFVGSLNEPRRAAGEAALFLHSADVRRGTRTRGANKEPAFVGKSVLLVDDDMRNIFALTAVLEREGLHVSFAEDGLQAIAAMNEAPETHVVLMDLMMPRMDGLTAIRTLRGDERFAKTPILAVTAKAMQGDREACLAAGASDYLTKPVNVDQLLSLLRVWLYDGPTRTQRM